MISLIVAADENNAIGFGNKMLWHLPNDLKYFKNKTWGMPIVMGRKTFESLGKVLPGRYNIIISSNEELKIENAAVQGSLDAAIAEAQLANVNEIMVIGGGEIYRQAMEKASTIYMTKIHTKVKEADTFFPFINELDFHLQENVDFFADQKHAYDYSFQTWVRKNSDQ